MKNLTIQFTNINITSLSANSGVFTGTNTQYDWTVGMKSNAGFGKIIGSDNVSIHNANFVHDNDVMDSDFSQNQGSNDQPVNQN
ncbi:hypothetical protein [Peribacillus frigoritolerans]|uniref:hypothetical protein n=1 Tax=Peribacillus frigoritolerans TaxID=450367 RepID=UPI0010598920|nr:hypothetical protein [Peribacillus frigoritolerans]TDL82120.1 hypothetical protein E2R53_00615 [Peribacillus frigoritolerans]